MRQLVSIEAAAKMTLAPFFPQREWLSDCLHSCKSNSVARIWRAMTCQGVSYRGLWYHCLIDRTQRRLRATRALPVLGGQGSRSSEAAKEEAGIRQHMIEDGQDPDHVPALEEIFTPRVIRKRLGMTQEAFARALHIPVATLRNWEQGRNAVDPAARSLLTIVARNPRLVLRTPAAE
jgi:putative transcriptional regulator